MTTAEKNTKIPPAPKWDLDAIFEGGSSSEAFTRIWNKTNLTQIIFDWNDTAQVDAGIALDAGGFIVNETSISKLSVPLYSKILMKGIRNQPLSSFSISKYAL